MIGQRLGSYLIEEKIGAGAMGEVYRATHEKTGRTAAVKIIINVAGQKARVPERFEREAKILESFRHPHIVRFLARGRYSGTNYVAMEYLTGGTLEDLLDRKTFLPWREVVEYAVQLCDALHYAHQQQIIHRDLKPSNLLFSDKRVMKLTDFGIAKDDSEDAEALTATGRTLGTAAYMAPEQIKGEPKISHKTDLYALGCLLYQMLTGQTPFRGASPVVLMHMHLSEKPPRVSSKVPDIPRALDDLVLALMAKEPSKRPFDAAKVKHDLEELRAKANRGEPIPSVFEGGESPTRMGMLSPTTSTNLASSSSDEKTGKPRRGLLRTTFSGSTVDPERIKTIALATALIAGLGLTGYLLWPPSAQVLHRQAEVLMATANPSDWKKADREFLVELDRRFPEQFAAEKRVWRDKIGLEEARRRAVVLESPNAEAFGISRPQPGPETTFVTHANLARAASKAGGDAQAIDTWKEMASILSLDDPKERSWHLLALDRIAQLEADAANRRTIVTKMLNEADALESRKQPEDSQKLREAIVEQYGKHPDVQKMIREHAKAEPAAKPGS